MINNVDIVADLSWGDTGKGKVVSHLAKKNKYDYKESHQDVPYHIWCMLWLP